MATLHKKISVKDFLAMLRDAFSILVKNDPLRMAGATAFFTTFALPPITIIIIAVLGLVFNPKKLSRQLFEGLGGIIKKESVHQIADTLAALQELANTRIMSIGGFIFLLFVATTLFKVIKGSLNQLWRIKVNGKINLWVVFRIRIQAILVILMAGVLFVPGLLADSAQDLLSAHMQKWSPGLTYYFTIGLNFLISVFIVMLWFAILFRVLPDGRPAWKVAFVGALFTSVLFNIGKLILNHVLRVSNIHQVYGASGSIVLVLLFVFYSSLILYYGAAFTKIWGSYHDSPITPLPHAMSYKLSAADEDQG
jgi:membrane protein